ncbi:hypothetical protein B566_EDAN008595 [Ephemera danica]|nr:hypothetical protein B566_EDAN008595 [Ephemera danica]
MSVLFVWCPGPVRSKRQNSAVKVTHAPQTTLVLHAAEERHSNLAAAALLLTSDAKGSMAPNRGPRDSASRSEASLLLLLLVVSCVSAGILDLLSPRQGRATSQLGTDCAGLADNATEDELQMTTDEAQTSENPCHSSLSCSIELAMRQVAVRDDNETRCYDELGCLELTKGWYHLIYRPFNVFPLPREVVNTRFILHTRKNPSEGQVLSAQNDKTIRKSNFDVKKPTKMIIHGFIDTPLSNWVKYYTECLDPAEPYFQGMPSYVRLDTSDAEFVDVIHTDGKSIFLLGLDPAEPYFQGMPSYVRLDTSDAEFVDVIHTDGKSIFLLGYGMNQPCGHIDFYPNNGKEQPGCDIAENPVPLTLVKEGLEEASRVLLACNHVRAIKLFTDSINSRCPYVAHHCDSFDGFMQGRCYSCKENATDCAVMGLAAEETGLALSKPAGKFFTTTGKEFPYCRRHYRITLELARPPRAEVWVQGFMRISLLSDDAAARNIDLTPSGYVKLQHGHSRTFVVSHPVELGTIRKVEFYWEYDMDVLQPRSLCFFWCNDHLYVSRIQLVEMDAPPTRGKRDDSEDSGEMVELCSASTRGYTDIASRSSAMFYDNC